MSTPDVPGSLRILVLNQYFPPDTANSAKLISQLTEDLAAAGHRVTVVAGRPSYTVTADAPAGSDGSGPEVVRVRSTGFDRVAMAGRGLNYVSYFVAATVRAMRLPAPDVVVAFTDPPFIALASVLVARRHRARLVHVYYDIYPDVAVAVGRLRSGPAIALWRTVNRFTRRRADRIVAIGRDMRENLEADGVDPAKIEVLSNWAEPNRTDRDSIDRIRAELGWDGRFVILHAGNVGLGHNLERFVEAAVDAAPDVRFVIMGDGAAKGDLQARARNLGAANLEFLPYQPHERAQAIIAAADCHFISLAPGLTGWIVPSKVYGVMASGRPFLAAVEERCEVARLAEEFECGLRVEPDSASAIVDGIAALRSGNYEEMGRRGRAASEVGLHRSTVTDRYAAMLRDLVKDEPGTG